MGTALKTEMADLRKKKLAGNASCFCFGGLANCRSRASCSEAEKTKKGAVTRLLSHIKPKRSCGEIRVKGEAVKEGKEKANEQGVCRDVTRKKGGGWLQEWSDSRRKEGPVPEKERDMWRREEAKKEQWNNMMTGGGAETGAVSGME
ncbi:UNVERIFIED_CONTAM: hypothetical protein K2H54_058562 [Gekko kuhli]